MCWRFYDGIEAKNYLLANTPDVVFLDIDMPGLNGLDMLRGIKKRLNAIITTSHRNYGADSYDLNAIDFVTKPITSGRLEKAINKVLDKINTAIDLQNYKSKYSNINFDNKKEFESIEIIILRGAKVKIYLKDIIVINSNNHNVKIICDRKQTL